MEKFAERLKELRTNEKLSRAQLAKNTGLSHQGIAQWESCTREPSGSVLIKLADYFDVSIDYLVGRIDY